MCRVGRSRSLLETIFARAQMEAYSGVASFYGFTWLEEELKNYISVEATGQ